MASHPYFNPNTLQDDWVNSVNDTRSPFLNRAIQGSYSPGTVLGPFLLAALGNEEKLPEIPERLTYSSGTTTIPCGLPIPTGVKATWGTVIEAGCPSPLMALGSQLKNNLMIELFSRLGFYTLPSIPLQIGHATAQPANLVPDMAAIGLDDLQVSPLQMALAAGAFSSNGALPSPILATAIHTAESGWEVLQTQPSTPALSNTGVLMAQKLMTRQDTPLWQAVGFASTSGKPVTWYIAGTQVGWKGEPIAMARSLHP